MLLFQSSIHSRTAYVISAILNAESPESVLRRIERFIDHLQEYPETRDYAIKVWTSVYFSYYLNIIILQLVQLEYLF